MVVKKIKKKYYDYFINDILNLKLQKQNILNIKKILSSNNVIKNNATKSEYKWLWGTFRSSFRTFKKQKVDIKKFQF